MYSNIKQQISAMQKPQLLLHHREWLLESFRVSETLIPSPFLTFMISILFVQLFDDVPYLGFWKQVIEYLAVVAMC